MKNPVRLRPLPLFGLLVCLVIGAIAFAGASGGGQVAAGTPGAGPAPQLKPHNEANLIHDENQKPGTSSFHSKELEKGRGRHLSDLDDDTDKAPKQNPHKPKKENGNGADDASDLSYDAVDQTSTCGTDCWTDTVIRGYAFATSINHGDAISFYVSTAQPRYNLDIYRIGWYGGAGSTLVTSVPNLPGQNQAVPTPDPTTGLIAGTWAVSYTLQTTATWTTGVYLVKMTASSGDVGYMIFVVRDDSSTAPLVYELPVATYQAYNNWGGKSLYAFNSTGAPAAKVSFDRPYSDYDGAGDLFDGDYGFIRFLESKNYNITYVTSTDVQANPSLLSGHKAFISPWHDEYWSQQMRANIQAARDAGVHLAFFDANNMYWQIRWEASASGVANRVIVCYKDASTDPVEPTTPAQTTVQWRQSPVSQPENAFLGAMYSWAYTTTDPAFPWVVSNASNWIFTGTGLVNGSSIPGVVGYEWDKVYANGLQPQNLTVLSNSPTKDAWGNADTSNSTIYTACSGAYVFDAGTIYWAWALDSNTYQAHTVSAALQKVTTNILDAFIATTATPLSNCNPNPTPTPNPTPGTLNVYADSVNGMFENDSWNAGVNFANTAQHHSGADSIALSIKAAWGALYLYDGLRIDPSPYTALTFWLKASQAGQAYEVGLVDPLNRQMTMLTLANYGGQPTTAWKQYTVPLSDLNPNHLQITGIVLQDGLGKVQPNVFIDDVALVSPAIGTATPTPNTPGQLTVYDNHLAPGWSNASWYSATNLLNTSPAHSSPDSISLTVTTAWGAFYASTSTPLDTTPFTNLQFWAQAGAAGEAFTVSLVDTTNTMIKSVSLASYGGQPTTGAWKQYIIPMADLNGVGKQIQGFVIQDGLGKAQPALYLDDLKFDNTPIATPTPTPSPQPTPTGTYLIYGDQLAGGWGNNSWSATTNLANTSPVHSGADSIAVTITAAWGALSLYGPALNTTPYGHLSLAVQGSTAGQAYYVSLVNTSNQMIKLVPLANYGGNPPVGSWTVYSIPLADLSATGTQITGVVVQDGLGKAQPVAYVDDIQLTP